MTDVQPVPPGLRFEISPLSYAAGSTAVVGTLAGLSLVVGDMLMSLAIVLGFLLFLILPMVAARYYGRRSRLRPRAITFDGKELVVEEFSPDAWYSNSRTPVSDLRYFIGSRRDDWAAGRLSEDQPAVVLIDRSGTNIALGVGPADAKPWITKLRAVGVPRVARRGRLRHQAQAALGVLAFALVFILWALVGEVVGGHAASGAAAVVGSFTAVTLVQQADWRDQSDQRLRRWLVPVVIGVKIAVPLALLGMGVEAAVVVATTAGCATVAVLHLRRDTSRVGLDRERSKWRAA